MKRIMMTLAVPVVALLVMMAAAIPQEEEKLSINAPDEVKQAIEHSCFGCHSKDSQSDKAKDKLNFSEWQDLSGAGKVAVLEEICEVVSEGEMPPEKFLEKYPDHALKEGQAQKICDWTNKYIDELMGE